MPKFYVVLSKTTTNIGKCIRVFSSCQYNHSAISFDRDLTQLYAFARRQKNSCLTAGLVHESTARYMEVKGAEVPIKVYEFNATDEQVNYITAKVKLMLDNPEYMYQIKAKKIVIYDVVHKYCEKNNIMEIIPEYKFVKEKTKENVSRKLEKKEKNINESIAKIQRTTFSKSEKNLFLSIYLCSNYNNVINVSYLYKYITGEYTHVDNSELFCCLPDISEDEMFIILKKYQSLNLIKIYKSGKFYKLFLNKQLMDQSNILDRFGSPSIKSKDTIKIKTNETTNKFFNLHNFILFFKL